MTSVTHSQPLAIPSGDSKVCIRRRLLPRAITILVLIAVGIVLLAAAWVGFYVTRYTSNLRRFAAEPQAGFHSEFYVYVSPRAAEIAAESKPVTILVIPNNSGTTSDDLSVHQRDAWWMGFERCGIANELEVVLLVPAFPRPATGWEVYTHALDRDVLTTDRAELRRLDLQLIAMLQKTRDTLRSEGILCDEKILIHGFSAGGMFANRFVALHPGVVKAAAIGSPGGWPLIPLEREGDERLPYPIGVGDWKELTGEDFDAEGFRQVPQLIYMGSLDDNDSVDFRDGWDEEHAELVDRLFGADPQTRWPKAQASYKKFKAAAQFELVEGVGHDRKRLQHLGTDFFKKQLQRDR